jgi:hypothetical protein
MFLTKRTERRLAGINRWLAGVPSLVPQTSRLHTRVQVVGSVRYGGCEHAVRGIDLERKQPRLRLDDGLLVPAAMVEASDRPAGVIRRSGAAVRFRRPGRADPGTVRADLPVTVVVRWSDLDLWALAYWYAPDLTYGVVREEDLDCR